MATQFVEGQPPRAGMGEHEKKTVEVAGAGATTEAIGAAAAVVLSIIGLAGALPAGMMAVATIVLGAAILLDAGAVGARYRRLLDEAWARDERLVRAELGGGISAGSLAGIAGIVLGILALLGFAPIPLCSIGIIVFGAALMFGSAAKGRLASFNTGRYGLAESTRHVIDETLSMNAGGEVLVGIGAVVLGILALLGVQPTLTLVLVGLLGVGVAVLLAGSAFGARMFSILRQGH
jgi:hypothetical protein